jgi:hypothetical protein
MYLNFNIQATGLLLSYEHLKMVLWGRNMQLLCEFDSLHNIKKDIFKVETK